MIRIHLKPTNLFACYLIVLSVALGQIAGRFESGWYLPINLNELFWLSMSMVVMSHCCLIFIAPIVLILCLIAIVKRPEKISSKLLILFLPFVPFVLMLFWVSFVKIRFSNVGIFGFEHWTYKIFEQIIFLLDTHFILIATYVAFSACWSHSRLFGISVLLIEYCCFFTVKFIASMACSNVWL